MTQTTHPRAALPPGQPPPTVCEHPTVVFGGALATPVEVAVDELVGTDRRELHADFHCVAGWSVTGLQREGVAFADVYQRSTATPTSSMCAASTCSPARQDRG